MNEHQEKLINVMLVVDVEGDRRWIIDTASVTVGSLDHLREAYNSTVQHLKARGSKPLEDAEDLAIIRAWTGGAFQRLELYNSPSIGLPWTLGEGAQTVTWHDYELRIERRGERQWTASITKDDLLIEFATVDWKYTAMVMCDAWAYIYGGL